MDRITKRKAGYGLAASAAVLLFCMFTCCLMKPAKAYAEDSLELVAWSINTSTDTVDVAPYQANGYPFAALEFNYNISYYTLGSVASYKESNKAKVILQKADGTAVTRVDDEALFSAYTNDTEPGGYWVSDNQADDAKKDAHSYLYIETEINACDDDHSFWLEPLTDYQIVIEPGVETYYGLKSTKRYVINFRTDAETSSGLTVYQYIAIGVGTAVLVAGVTTQFIYRRKRRKAKSIMEPRGEGE